VSLTKVGSLAVGVAIVNFMYAWLRRPTKQFLFTALRLWQISKCESGPQGSLSHDDIFYYKYFLA